MNVLHKYSSKPVLNTSRDALLVAIITVIIIIILTSVYHLVTGNIKYTLTGEYWQSIGKSFLTSFVLGYAYEYSGVNARLSADSMRYAKGSMLNKYETRNQAIFAETAADLAIDKINAIIPELTEDCKKKFDDVNAITKNANTLRVMARSTRELKEILRGAEAGKSSAEIHAGLVKRYQTGLSAEDVELLLNLDTSPGNVERLAAVPRLIEILGSNEELMKYFMVTGFGKLAAVKVKNAWTLDTSKLSADTGVKINSIGVGAKTINPGDAEANQALSREVGQGLSVAFN